MRIIHALFVILLQPASQNTAPPAADWWNRASAIATCLYAAAFVFTIWYVHRQLDEMKQAGLETKKAGETEAALRVLEYINESATRRARWILFSKRDALRNIMNEVAERSDAEKTLLAWDELDRKIYDEWRDARGEPVEFQDLELSLKLLDNVACLINEDYAPSDLLVGKLLKNEFIRWWSTFGPYIRYRRDRTKQPQGYCWHLQTLIARTIGKQPEEITPSNRVPEVPKIELVKN